MTESQPTFKLPPRATKSDRQPRRVGFELEFTGLTLDQTFEVLRDTLGGKPGSETAAERSLEVEDLGAFNIELDWDFLKRKAAETGAQEDSAEWVDLLGQAAAQLVPMEVVCPPVAVTRLDELQGMVQALRAAGARGTEDSPIAAYGVHINTEIPALEAATLFDYVRAFALLQWWLVDAHEVDTTRRISPYIDLFPQAYVERLLSREAAEMDQIFADYLEHNATRNRALDLLPMLAEIDEQQVREAVDDPKINPRPAFHYRLPNCHIERPDWSLSIPWNTWLVVERLAGEADALQALAAEYLDAARPLLGVSRSDWVRKMDTWLQDHELV